MTTTQSSRWCSPKLVTHSLQVAYSERRCRECVGVIGRRERYWQCCTECHPLCLACFEALGPSARRLEPVSNPTPAEATYRATATEEAARQATATRADAALRCV